MARARNIKPGFFHNEDIVELEFEYRLLFIGLWTLADREGRLEDRPKKIKMALFPADNVDVDEGISELARGGFVRRYEVENCKYIQILKFSDHQNPHHQEKASAIPAPPISEVIPDKTEGNPADSLIPDSLIPDSLQEISPTPSDDDAEPVVMALPLNDKTEFQVLESVAVEMQELYPAIDVMQALREIRAWNLANPKNRKTRAGAMKHINSWLAREQNKARTGNAANRPAPKASVGDRAHQQAEAARERILAGKPIGGGSDVGSDGANLRLLVGKPTGTG